MRRLKALPWYWYGLVIVIFLCLMEIWGILGNWSTIFLAAVTLLYVMLVHKSILSTSILRREDRVLDFKRRQLDWIVNWAREVRKELLMPRAIQVYTGVLSNLFKQLQSYANESPIMIETAKIFGAEFEGIVEKAAKDLWAYIEALKKPTRHTTIDHNLYITELNQSFSNVMKSALKVESDLAKTSNM